MQKGVGMSIVYKRPVVSFCIMHIIGILTAFLSNSILAAAGLFLLMSAFLYVFREKRTGGFFVPVGMLAFFLLGSLEFLAIDNIQLRCFSEYEGREVAVRGFIASEAQVKGERVTYVVNVAGIRQGYRGGYKPHKGRILLTALLKDDSVILEYGREVFFDGTLTQPQGVRNPGGFDYRRYLAQKGVGASVFAYPHTIETGRGKRGNFLVQAGLSIRDRIVYVINNSLPRQQAGLLNGMLIGYREGLSEEVQTAFANAGLTHIMAVSGANIAFIIMPLSFLFKLMKIRKRAANLLIIGILALFVFITGFEPSVLRAALMADIMLMASILYKKPDVYAAIAFSCIILLAVSPCMLFNAGFQLSYGATLGIVMLCRNISTLIVRCHIPEKPAQVMAATVSAQLGVLPVTLINFNRISLISIIPNVLVAPILELITILGMLMALLGQFSLFLSRLTGYLNSVFLSAVLYITKWTSELSFVMVTTVTPSLLMAAGYYTVVWFLLWYKPMKMISLRPRHAAIALSFAAAFMLAGSLKPACLEVVFLDVGQGDSAFVRTYSGKTVLIDGGGSNDPDVKSGVGEKVVVPFLLDKGCDRLDAVIATHPHTDHIQGLEDVLEQIKTCRLIIPSMKDESGFGGLLRAAGENGIPVSRCARGDIIRLDDRTVMQILNPEADCDADGKSSNNASLVIKLCYEQTSVLLTGDAESEAEDRMLKEAPYLDADVIKIAHHGSPTSTGKAFLEAVSPEAAIISVGRNYFGHPSDEVLDVLEESGVSCFRTDECGAVIVRSDGKSIAIRRTVTGK